LQVSVLSQCLCQAESPARKPGSADQRGEGQQGKKMQAPALLQQTSDICLSAAEEQGHGNPGHLISGGTPFF